jgi:DNA-binding NarL/FixJ family response regulator
MIVKSNLLKIWIVGTQPVTLSGFKVYVETNFPDCKLKVFNSYEGLSEEERNEEPVILIYDLPLIEKSSLDALAIVLQQSKHILPIVYLDNPKVYQAWQLLNLGAKGIMNKHEPLEYLQSCIISILQGGLYFSQNLLQGFIDPMTDKSSSSILTLSRRQQQILNLISKGYRTNDISRELKLYPSTVSTQKKVIFDKLGLGNWNELKHHVSMQS